MAKVSPSETILEADKEFRTGNYTEAIRLCYEGLQNFPEFPSFYSLLSQSYIQLGQIDKAIEVIEQAIELFPFQRTFPLLLEKLHSKAPKETADSTSKDSGKIIRKLFSRYLLSPPISIFVNVPRNYFATRIDIPDIPKPKKIGLLGPVSRLINIVR